MDGGLCTDFPNDSILAAMHCIGGYSQFFKMIGALCTALCTATLTEHDADAEGLRSVLRRVPNTAVQREAYLTGGIVLL